MCCGVLVCVISQFMILVGNSCRNFLCMNQKCVVLNGNVCGLVCEMQVVIICRLIVCVLVGLLVQCGVWCRLLKVSGWLVGRLVSVCRWVCSQLVSVGVDVLVWVVLLYRFSRLCCVICVMCRVEVSMLVLQVYSSDGSSVVQILFMLLVNQLMLSSFISVVSSFSGVIVNIVVSRQVILCGRLDLLVSIISNWQVVCVLCVGWNRL